MKLSYENQISRINHTLSKVNELKQLSLEHLKMRPDKDAWSILEIVNHMCRSYDPHYRREIDRVISQNPLSDVMNDQYHASWTSSLFIKGLAPKNGKRKWKMKTLKQFEPQPDFELGPEVIDRFMEEKTYMKQQLMEARKRKLGHGKVVSAIGPLIKFTLPEATEFVISHDERHLLQIEEWLEMMNIKKDLAESR